MKRSLLINLTIVSSSLVVFLISLRMLSAGVTAVFPHFYYLPILLSAYYYPKLGHYITAVICLSYILPVMWLFPGDSLVLFSALIRVFMFILVAALVSSLVIRSEAEHEKNEQLLEFQNKIIENPQVMVTVADREEKVIIWNRGAENITGYLKEEVMGGSGIWNSIMPDKETIETVESIIFEITSNSEIAEGIPLPLLRKDGNTRYLLVSLQGLNTKDGNHSGILCIAVDITEKRQLEAENRAALARIEKNISQMYVLNDEIRNPLAVILGQAEIGGCSSKEIIAEQVGCINDIITLFDRDSMESTKILEYLRKHYGFFK